MATVTDVTVKKKILVQLGVPFFAMAGFVIAAIIFGTLYFAGKLRDEGSPQDPKTIAASLQESLEAFFAETRTSIEPVAFFLQDDAPTNEEETMLRSLLSNNRAILGIAFFDETGTEIYELHKSRAEEGLLDALSRGATHIALARQNINGKPVFLNAEGGGSYFVWAYPRFNGGNEIIGAFSVGVDAGFLKERMSSLSLVSPIRVMLVDAKTTAPLISFNTLEADVTTAGPSESNFRIIFENDRRDYGYVLEDGSRIEGHFEPIGRTGWNILAEAPGGGLPRGVANLFVVAAIIIIIFIALVFIYLYVVNKNMILPLRKIERTMHYFKTGDYSEPVKVEVENEFVAVADQLNTMSKHIEDNTSERVAQLKKVLERQNMDTKLLIEKDVELREQGQKLKELDQAKSMFVSVAAHQMRTPLAAIKWAIKLVMDGDVGPVNAEQKEYLNKGYESTSRMINLINDLLDVDKIESDKFSYVFKEEKLEDILQGIVDDLTPISNEKGVNLLFQKQSESYPAISADQVKLRNALQNLIDNAIKYTIGGGDVTVKLMRDKDILRLTISDTGIGIPVSEQSKVFGKFFRAKNAVRKQTDGSGLGLFIVKKIVEKHNGEISFESKEGKGTTFFITLPGKDGGGVPISQNAPKEEKIKESPEAVSGAEETKVSEKSEERPKENPTVAMDNGEEEN